MLAFLRIEDESTLGRYDHIPFIMCVLSLCKKYCTNVLCLIGDNCHTNKSIATSQNLSLLRCTSHRFNLAVNYFLSDEADIVQKISALM